LCRRAWVGVCGAHFQRLRAAAHDASGTAQRDLSLDFPLTLMGMGNQAQVLLLPDPGADLVTLTVRDDVGAIDDPVGQEGISLSI